MNVAEIQRILVRFHNRCREGMNSQQSTYSPSANGYKPTEYDEADSEHMLTYIT
jgi:hypothetical protein